MGYLLSHYLNIFIYQVLLNAKASEHSARMVAMKNATDNAKQLIKDLTLEYNKLRQGNITKELLEITSGQSATELNRPSDTETECKYEQRQNRSSHRSGGGRRVPGANCPGSTTR